MGLSIIYFIFQPYSNSNHSSLSPCCWPKLIIKLIIHEAMNYVLLSCIIDPIYYVHGIEKRKLILYICVRPHFLFAREGGRVSSTGGCGAPPPQSSIFPFKTFIVKLNNNCIKYFSLRFFCPFQCCTISAVWVVNYSKINIVPSVLKWCIVLTITF